ncbi:19254_t:CDS:1, partial [Cetraspora pellucida]
AGPKTCLGMKMAQLDLKTVLAILIRNFEYRPVEGFNVEDRATIVSKPVPGVDLFVSKVDY